VNALKAIPEDNSDAAISWFRLETSSEIIQ
jgi:hypothetical protein